mgnify:CR=1 FL=1
MENLYDVIIIGSGPAGLSCRDLMQKRAKLSSLTIEAKLCKRRPGAEYL